MNGEWTCICRAPFSFQTIINERHKQVKGFLKCDEEISTKYICRLKVFFHHTSLTHWLGRSHKAPPAYPDKSLTHSYIRGIDFGGKSALPKGASRIAPPTDDPLYRWFRDNFSKGSKPPQKFPNSQTGQPVSHKVAPPYSILCFIVNFVSEWIRIS